MRSTRENRRFSKWTGSAGCPAAGSVMDDFFHGQLGRSTGNGENEDNHRAGGDLPNRHFARWRKATRSARSCAERSLS